MTSTTSHETSHERVQRLADRADLIDLLTRQGRWLDEKRFDESRTIFTEDVIGDFPSGQLHGVDQLTERARRNHAEFDRTQHLTTNHLIDLAGDHATVTAQLVAVFTRHATTAAPEFALGEQYRFEAVRTPQGWRFSRLQMRLHWRVDTATPEPDT
ncbi:nuclear transport factor 2 family protein [Salinactinospora qingdaonensis]|uniref:SnoaL-like domain-containing protein n=1 Tax=Salinactinospora qingdaonensis TaxID=702744 RepID=A0ABP7F8L8_9ACTN